MRIYNAKKGVNNIKTLQTVTSLSSKEQGTADFLNLYMLEKEKQRLMSEEIKILRRLDFVHNRLKIIQNIYEHNSHLLQNKNYQQNQYDEDNVRTGFTTMQIEY
ncbi:MAG: hypothetical protein WCI90_00665 [Chlorobium sp.]|nr:MAG: hypothetical protein FDX17_04300 [Chlorobium sp.]